MKTKFKFSKTKQRNWSIEIPRNEPITVQPIPSCSSSNLLYFFWPRMARDRKLLFHRKKSSKQWTYFCRNWHWFMIRALVKKAKIYRYYTIKIIFFHVDLDFSIIKIEWMELSWCYIKRRVQTFRCIIISFLFIFILTNFFMIY